jgi:hypothetical protein
MGARKIVLAAMVGLLIVGGAANADIVHRYSFTNDASDSVGGADGVLFGGASVSGGQLVLNGVDGYCQLPIGNTLGTLHSATFEGWATWMPPQDVYWSRIFDFGNDQIENMFLTPFGGNRRFRFAITIDGGGDEEQTIWSRQFPRNEEHHFAVTIDGAAGITTLYIDGVAAAKTWNTLNTPADLTAPTTSNFLGKSQYNDPYYSGSINEFRIYNTALSADDVLASYQAGPDAP